jgi:thiamine transport system substrate-binding protein
MRVLGLAALLTVTLGLAACGSSPTAAPSTSVREPVTVRMLTHDSFVLSTALLTDFTARTGITIEVVAVGDAGELVNRAVLSAGKPEGDVLFGVDNSLLSRAVSASVFEPYVSPEVSNVRPEIAASGNGIVTPIDDGDVCVNIDNVWFDERGVAPPKTLDDLTMPKYAGLFVTQNPATSSPGLAFMLATIAKYGDGWRDYWSQLRANDALAVNGWTEAYTSEFSGAGNSGSRPLVVSYSSSPPAEIIYAADPARATVTTSTMTDGCYRQIEYAGVLAGASHPDAAKAVIDWLLSPEVQGDLALSMFVFPARAGVALPQEFAQYAPRPARPEELSAEEVGANQQQWLNEWTETFVS